MSITGGLNPSASIFIPEREVAHSNTTCSHPELFTEDTDSASAGADSTGIVYTTVYTGLNYHQRLHAINSSLESRWSKPEPDPDPEPEPPETPTAINPPEPEPIGHPAMSVINGIPRGACRLQWLKEALGRSRSGKGSGVIVSGIVFSGEDPTEATSAHVAPRLVVPHTSTSINRSGRYTDTFDRIEDGDEIPRSDEIESWDEISGRNEIGDQESKSRKNGGGSGGENGVCGEMAVPSVEFLGEVGGEDANSKGDDIKTIHISHVEDIAGEESPLRKANIGDTACPRTHVANGSVEVRSFPADVLPQGAIWIPAYDPIPTPNSTNVGSSGAASRPQSRRRRRATSTPLV